MKEVTHKRMQGRESRGPAEFKSRDRVRLGLLLCVRIVEVGYAESNLDESFVFENVMLSLECGWNVNKLFFKKPSNKQTAITVLCGFKLSVSSQQVTGSNLGHQVCHCCDDLVISHAPRHPQGHVASG